MFKPFLAKSTVFVVTYNPFWTALITPVSPRTSLTVPNKISTNYSGAFKPIAASCCE
jgi:hypothetical protein